MKNILIQGNTFSIIYESQELDEEIGKKLFKDFESEELFDDFFALKYPFPEPIFFRIGSDENATYWISMKQTHVYEDPLEEETDEEE